MLRRTASLSPPASWPATKARPDVALASVHKILIVVVLPAPLGPRKPKVSPLVTAKSMPRTASTSPYRLVSPLAVRPGGGGRVGRPGASAGRPPARVSPAGLPAPAPPLAPGPMSVPV